MPPADLLRTLATAAAAGSGPDPALDYRIAEAFGLAPDPDAYGTELTPFGNGFDWRAPAFTAAPDAVRQLARLAGQPDLATSAQSPRASLAVLLNRLARAD